MKPAAAHLGSQSIEVGQNVLGGKETINDSDSFAGNLLGANSDQPTLGKLYQHKMDGVLDSLESNVKDDRKALQSFLSKCG